MLYPPVEKFCNTRVQHNVEKFIYGWKHSLAIRLQSDNKVTDSADNECLFAHGTLASEIINWGECPTVSYLILFGLDLLHSWKYMHYKEVRTN